MRQDEFRHEHWHHATPPRPLTPWDVQPGPESCTVIAGTAGSGKSTLLEQWFDAVDQRFEQPVWHAVIPGRPNELPTGLTASSDGSPIDWVLFVDDAGHLTEDEIGSYLLAMAQEKPGLPNRIVLATRAVPTQLLDWSRQLDLKVVRMDDLDPPDGMTEEILRHHRPDLDPVLLTKLAKELRSWPALAHLAGRSIAHATAGDDMARFDGDDLGVSDYFDTEIFAGLDTLDQRFLVTCAVLPVLSADTCAMLTGDQFADDRLRRLARQHALIRPAARDGIWAWRPLAQPYLLGKLDRWPADEVTELRRRFRGWSMAKRSYPEAVAQASQSGDWNVVVRLILDIGLDTVAAGDGSTVLRWIDALPHEVCRSAPGIGVVAAMALWATRGDDAADTIADWLAHADSIPVGRPPRGAPTIATATALTRSLLGSCQPDQRLALASETNPTGADAPWTAFRHAAIGVAAYLDDNGQLARQALTDCLSQQDQDGTTTGWFMDLLGAGAIGLLAIVEQDTNEIEQAGMLLAMAEMRRPTGPLATVDPAGTMQLAEARQAWLRGQLAAAGDGLLTTAKSAGFHWVSTIAQLDLAELASRRGDRAGQAAALAAADALIDDRWTTPAVVARLRQAAERDHEGEAGSDDDGGLTERELEVLRLLDSDLTRRQIAAQLFLAHNTVKTYIQRLYQKLGVSSRPAALARARERGWLQ